MSDFEKEKNNVGSTSYRVKTLISIIFVTVISATIGIAVTYATGTGGLRIMGQGILDSASTPVLSIDTNARQLVSSGGTSTLSWANGKVGIGTTSPTEALNVMAEGNLNGIRVKGVGNVNTAITFDTGNYGGYEWRISALGTGHSAGVDKLAFLDGTTIRMLIDSTGNVGIGTTTPATALSVNGAINATDVVYASGGNSTNWNTAYGWGNHATAGYLTSSESDGTLTAEDNRIISPSELASTKMKFGFTTYNNDNASPWADFIHLRSYQDSSGGKDNLLVFNKSTGLGMRLYQQDWSSSTPYSVYKDVVLADNTPTANYLPKYSSAGTNVSVTNSSIYDNGNVGIGTTTSYNAKLTLAGGVSDSYGGTLALLNSRTNGAKSFITATDDTWTSTGGNKLGFGFGTISSANVKMILDASGNVGIGTTSPTRPLDVIKSAVGSTAYIGSVDDGLLFQNSSGLGTIVGVNSAANAYNDIEIRAGASGSGLYLNTTGNVGIGVVAPTARLQIVAPNASTSVPAAGTINNTVAQYNTNSDPAYGLSIGVLGTGQSWLQSQRTTGSATTYPLLLNPNGGNVGIGTTSPAGKLTVAATDTSGVTDFLVNPTTKTSGNLLDLQINGSSKFSINTAGTFTASGDIYGGDLYANKFYDRGNNAYYLDPTNATTSLLVAGNVGIGTTTPGAKLEVNGVLAISGANYFRMNGIDIMQKATNGTLNFWSTNYAFNSGNVGIGTSSPSTKLDVYGTVKVSHDATSSLSIAAGSDGSTNFTTAGSNASLFFKPLNGRTYFNGGSVNNMFYAYDYSTAGSPYLSLSAHTLELNTSGNDTNKGRVYLNDNGSSFFTGGKVGIGTTTPLATLSIQGTSSAPTISPFAIASSTGASLFTVLPSGNVGIGTTTPGYPLTVAGDVNFTGTLRQNGTAFSGSQWTSSSTDIYYNTGNVGIGTITPNKKFEVGSLTNGAIQFNGTSVRVDSASGIGYNRIWSDGTDMTYDSSGKNQFNYQGSTKMMIDTSGNVGIGTSTPGNTLTVATGSIRVSEKVLAAAESMTINWREGNQQLVRISTTGITMTFSNYEAGQNLKLVVCNPDAGTPGTITWPGTIAWSGGSAPSQTLTNSKCDIWSFIATMGTSTLNIFGAQSPEF